MAARVSSEVGGGGPETGPFFSPAAVRASQHEQGYTGEGLILGLCDAALRAILAIRGAGKHLRAAARTKKGREGILKDGERRWRESVGADTEFRS